MSAMTYLFVGLFFAYICYAASVNRAWRWIFAFNAIGFFCLSVIGRSAWFVLLLASTGAIGLMAKRLLDVEKSGGSIPPSRTVQLPPQKLRALEAKQQKIEHYRRQWNDLYEFEKILSRAEQEHLKSQTKN